MYGEFMYYAQDIMMALHGYEEYNILHIVMIVINKHAIDRRKRNKEQDHHCGPLHVSDACSS